MKLLPLLAAAMALPAHAQTASEATSLGWTSIVGTLLSLLLVLALAWGALHLLKRMQFGQGLRAGQNLGPQVLRSVSVGPRERLVVVRHHDSEMLLGVTAASIVLLERRPLNADLPGKTEAEPRL